MTSDKKNTKTTTTCLTPKLILKPTSNKPNTETSLFFPSAPIATGVFILPIKQKTYHHHNNHRRGRHSPKHLRKPPSFDSYLHSSTTTNTTTHCGYMTRTPSLSSSYSSTSSLVDHVSEFTNEEMMYGYSSQKSVPHRHHRRLSSAYKVRFAETSDDGSSIVSSSSSVDDWDDMDIEEEEEDYILVARQSTPQHYYDYHKKSST